MLQHAAPLAATKAVETHPEPQKCHTFPAGLLSSERCPRTGRGIETDGVGGSADRLEDKGDLLLLVSKLSFEDYGLENPAILG